MNSATDLHSGTCVIDYPIPRTGEAKGACEGARSRSGHERDGEHVLAGPLRFAARPSMP